MPVAGNVTTKTGFVGASHVKDSMTPFVQSFLETANDILNESQYDIFEEPKKVFRRTQSKEALKEFFCNSFLDENATDPFMSDEGYVEDQYAMMEQQFENNVDAIYEHSVLAEYNPIIGMTFPVHKNILMNMVFDKGAIQKVVATAPKFTYTMERRLLVDKNGNEIDMFTQQNQMTAAIDASNPEHKVEITLPALGGVDYAQAVGGVAGLDTLSLNTYICGLRVSKLWIEEGKVKPTVIDGKNWLLPTGTEESTVGGKEYANVYIPVSIKFTPTYDKNIDRAVQQAFTLSVMEDVHVSPATDPDVKKVAIAGTLAATFNKGKFITAQVAGTQTVEGGTAVSLDLVDAIMVSTKLDTSNAALDTCSVKWDVDTQIVEIPTATPINVTISPEEVKDIAALYQVNQLTKIMSLLKTTLANYKDDKIKAFLDDSFDHLPERAKSTSSFDYAPPAGTSYALSPLEWRHTMFFDHFDSQVTRMLQVLNDPNMVVTVFGDPDLIRKITPTEYTYQTPSSIGPVELDYKRTVVTSDKRVYQFIGSDKMRWSDTLVCILSPRNSNRVTYRIYDYQMYVSNEIRNHKNPSLPAVHAFERWIIDEYQPVQHRCTILNRSGIRPVTP